jgi:glyceraldehyde-3-phosphate dehydrogenase/erythrose-4-phosphate dehydrogenase
MINLAYLLKYDSVHGRFNGTVEVANFVNKETFVLLQKEILLI